MRCRRVMKRYARAGDLRGHVRMALTVIAHRFERLLVKKLRALAVNL